MVGFRVYVYGDSWGQDLGLGIVDNLKDILRAKE